MSNHTYRSGELTLAAHLERPSVSGHDLPGVVVCHGFPVGEGGGANSPATFPELAVRIAREMSWVVIVPSPRGMPGSEGSFSLAGWLGRNTYGDGRNRQTHLIFCWCSTEIDPLILTTSSTL